MSIGKLFSGEFYDRRQLESILKISAKNTHKKLKRIAKQMDKLIQYKTFNEGMSVCCRYRLCDKPYSDEYECLDDIQECKITLKEVTDKAAYLSDNSETILLSMYERRNVYTKYSELDESIGIKNSRRKIDQLESIGFVFHRRCKKESREVKLIEYKGKRKIELPFEATKRDKLINEVFR